MVRVTAECVCGHREEDHRDNGICGFTSCECWSFEDTGGGRASADQDDGAPMGEAVGQEDYWWVYDTRSDTIEVAFISESGYAWTTDQGEGRELGTQHDPVGKKGLYLVAPVPLPHHKLPRNG